MLQLLRVVHSFDCGALTDVECDKLEIIQAWAFFGCSSLRNIYLSCVEDVEQEAFYECTGLTDMKFSSNLEGIGELVFSVSAALWNELPYHSKMTCLRMIIYSKPVKI